MLAMNKVALGESEDGKGVVIKNSGQTLFGTQGTSKFEFFTEKLINELKEKKEMTNAQIVHFTIVEEFLPKHAKDILEKLHKDQKIEAFDQFGAKVEKKSQWNIAEKISKNIIFRFTA
jgi:hypothetical protein